MTTNVLILVILGAAAVAVLGYLVIQAAGRRRANQDIPPAMRPGYSDEQLERSVLERYMAWGVVLTLFFAVFLPLYWLREPMRLQGRSETRFVEAFTRGEELYQANCSQCHGTNLLGGAAPSPYDPTDSWPAPNLANLAARYAESPNVPDVRRFILNTLRQGRPGTPMPTWGADYGGPLTDQQLEDLTDFILANQIDEVEEAQPASAQSGQQLYEQNCVRCHGKDLEGIVGPSLVGVFERHNEESILGILRNGLYLPTGTWMPPWQRGYMYPDARYGDEALEKIISYLRSQQPAELPEGADEYQSPYQGVQQAQAEEGADARADAGAGADDGAAADEDDATTTDV